MKNKVLSILLSAVAAFGLWLYVITVESPESEKTYYEIPVVLQNKEILSDRGLMIVSETPKVTLALKGNRSTLNDLNEANINVITNVANIEKAGTHHLTYDIAYPGNVSHGDITVLSSSTDLITVKVENKVKKQIPVVIDYGGTSVPEGYIADLKNAKLDRTHIEVSGPESAMNHVHKAIIQVSLTDQKKTLSREYQYTLCNADGIPVNASAVTTNAEKVDLTVTIERMKQIVLMVNVIDGGGATAQNSTIKLDPVTIWVSGSDTLLENFNSLTIGTVNLGEMLNDATLTFPIEMPDGVTNQTRVNEVTVDVKFHQLTIKTFNITSISAINVPSGMEAAIITQALTVTVRGPAAMVNTMRETDISVVVDFSQATMGTVTRDAIIIITNPNFSSVGAVEDENKPYEVLAELKRIEKAETE